MRAKIQTSFNIYASCDLKTFIIRYANPGTKQHFLYAFRWTHSSLFSYYVSVTNLGGIWVYLDPFTPKLAESGEKV